MDDAPSLRRGWTTGACATAAAKAAFQALLTGAFPDPVEITLPRGDRVAFALAEGALDPDGGATAAVIKDAGDDPDVTHGALIRVRVRKLDPGAGLQFRAGAGVGTVTRPGLAIPPGEPAINPVPRRMIHDALAEAIGAGAPLDVEVEIAIPGGEALAARTLNGRLGVVGGLSILGTTGVVIPYSCAAWIHSIHRGVDVARAIGLTQVAGATGRTSEQAVAALHALPDTALLEMGDFVGGMLKYLRTHPVPRVTIAGGLAKMTKLAQGRLDLHSGRGAVDLAHLAHMAVDAGGSAALAQAMTAANTALEAFQLAAAEGVPLGHIVAAKAWAVGAAVLRGADIELEIALFDREGVLRGRAPFAPVHG
jgi:cobalt-precorrin-5B (C1)-methyltransferase